MSTYTGYIYKYLFPNGKVYIGQTIRNVNRRFTEHCCSARHSKGYILHNAINKYGKDNIVVDIVETIESANIQALKDILNEREIFFIQSLQTMYPTGYNSTVGGKSKAGYRHTEEAKKKISKANKGHFTSEETRRNLSKSLKGHIVTESTRKNISIGKINSTYKPSDETKKLWSAQRLGRTFSEEHKKHLSNALINRVISEETKEKIRIAKAHAVLQYNKENELMAEFPSVRSASLSTDTSVCNLHKCLSGKNKTANGYIWKYKL